MRMYALIQTGYVSMMELCDYYTLEESLKLYALYKMKNDVEAAKMEELERR